MHNISLDHNTKELSILFNVLIGCIENENSNTLKISKGPNSIVRKCIITHDFVFLKKKYLDFPRSSSYNV